jgi:ATP-dependent Clp protease adaptor protein ClpS
MAKPNTQTVTKTDLQYPSRYSVIIHNDDFTPMEFVIQLLIEVFNKPIEEAKVVTHEVHNNGKASAGVYGFEVAEQKVNECSVICSYHGHPLKVSMQKI